MPWPVSLAQSFLYGDFTEMPLDNIIVSDTDAGPPKIRKRFSGKMPTMAGSIQLINSTQYDDLMNFYYGEAEEGANYFTFPDQHGTNRLWRFAELKITPMGPNGWKAQIKLEAKPYA